MQRHIISVVASTSGRCLNEMPVTIAIRLRVEISPLHYETTIGYQHITEYAICSADDIN